ncbi:MAG: serine hydrolase [Candidatus Micrarchaeia archaeon]
MSSLRAIAVFSVLMCLMLVFGCTGQKASNGIPQFPAAPSAPSVPSVPSAHSAAGVQGAACSSYSPDTCPSQCVVCPPCAECSSISCQTEGHCAGIGFNRSWYDGIKRNLASAQGQNAQAAGAIHPPTDAELARVVENFDAYAEKARKGWNVTGMSVAIVKGDKVLLLKGYGAKSAGGEPVTPGTVFSIGSTSKAFASTLVAMEVEKGAMEWDGKIKQYMPDFQMNDSWVANEMTVTDALAHRSGLSDHWGDELMYIGYNSSYMAHALRYAQPATSFRSTYAYQNTVYSLPSLIIEKITGKSWGENLKEQIFAPLGMENSSADYDSLMAAKDIATPYAYARSTDGSLSPEQVAWDSTIMRMAYWEPGAGGVNSNAADMSKWLIFQMGNGTYNGKRLLTAANLNYVHSPKTPFSNNMENAGFYAQGWLYQETNFGPVVAHSGAIGGYHTSVSFLPKEKAGIVILTNNVESSLSDALTSQFYAMYFGDGTADLSTPMLEAFKAEKAAESTKASPVPAVPALKLSAYAGNYANVGYGAMVVAEENGNLTATLGPAKIRLPLVPIGGNRFAHPGTPTDDMMFTSNPFEFGAENGTVKNLTLHLNAENVTFERGEGNAGWEE